MKLWEYIYVNFQEILYGIIYPLVALISFFYQPSHFKNPHPTKGTIVMVFCWFTPNIAHYKWVSYLEKKGYRTYLLNIPLLFENFDKSAERIDQFITEHKLKNCNLVGISTGALVGLYYLQMYKKWDKINRLISIGGPLRGTPTAWFISLIGKGRAMLPNSNFIRKLESIPLPSNKVITLSAVYDELVPREYSQVKGNTAYIIPVKGHNKFHLECEETYSFISKMASQKK